MFGHLLRERERIFSNHDITTLISIFIGPFYFSEVEETSSVWSDNRRETVLTKVLIELCILDFDVVFQHKIHQFYAELKL